MATSTLYSNFANIYDLVMQQVPYAKWANFLINIFQECCFGTDHCFLEIASGTGTLLSFMKNSYPNTHGIDISMPMLRKAQRKVHSSFIQADMRKLPFSDKVFDGIFCTHDSINYLQTRRELKSHFEEVKRILKPTGVYIFDVTTEKNVIENFHNQTFNEKHKEIQINWQNDYNFNKKELTSTLEFSNDSKINFLKRKTTHREAHVHKVHSGEDLATILSETNFCVKKKYADYDSSKPSIDANIMVYITSHDKEKDFFSGDKTKGNIL